MYKEFIENYNSEEPEFSLELIENLYLKLREDFGFDAVRDSLFKALKTLVPKKEVHKYVSRFDNEVHIHAFKLVIEDLVKDL